MKSSRFITSVSAAIATASANAAIPLPKTAFSTATVDAVEVSGATTQTTDLISTVSDVVSSHDGLAFSISVPAPVEWDNEIASEYAKLVLKEATGDISPEEEEKLENLQRLRRREMSPPSGEEVLLRYQREKLDKGMLELVNRYVRYQGPKSGKKRNTA